MGGEAAGKPAGAAHLEIRSILSNRDRLPYVQMEAESEGQKVKLQFTPDDAREQAMHILRTADAAESDHFVMTFLAENAHLNDAQLAGVLHEFRKYREAREFHPQPSSVLKT